MINQSTHRPHSLKWVNRFSLDFLNICSALHFHIHLNHEKCFQSVIYETREQKLFDNDKPQVHEPVPLFLSNSSHGYSGFALWQESTPVSRNSHSSSFTRTQVVLSGFGGGGGGVAHLNFCPFDELNDYDVELILKFWECRVLYPSRAPGMHTEHETCQPTSYHASRPVRNGRHLHFSISRRLRQREIMDFAATFLINARFDQPLMILNAQRWRC